MKNRPSLSRERKRALSIECGFRCSMPRCTHETGLEYHHIDGGPSNNLHSNLIVLCAVHHSMATKNQIDKLTMRTLKRLLVEQTLLSKSYTKILNSRKEYFEVAFEYLERTESYRATLVGPTFLHPELYVKRRNAKVQGRNYDTALLKFVLDSCSSGRVYDIRFIFRNTQRYIDKINQYIKKDERKHFIDDVLGKIDLVWGKNNDSGPDICCINTGFIHVETIFSDGYLSSSRKSPKSPLEKGILHFHPTQVELAKANFDEIFRVSSQGQESELRELQRFIKNLWKNT